jgi:FG-GAP repeat
MFSRVVSATGIAGFLVAAVPLSTMGSSAVRAPKPHVYSLSSVASAKWPTKNDQLGDPVVFLDNTAAVGAIGVKKSSGAAYIFAFTGKGFVRRASIADPADRTGDIFGYSIALSDSKSGMTMVVGTPNAASRHGAVYVYVRSGPAWHRQAILPDPDTQGVYPEYGYAVAISGNTLLVGSINEGTNGQGVVYSYERAGGTWRLHQTIVDPLGKTNDNFGIALAMSGTTVVIGADNATHRPYQGAAYVYTRVGESWHLQRKLKNPGGTENDFGYAVQLYGKTAVVGAPSQSKGGAIYVFTRSGSGWRHQATFSDPRHNKLDNFGSTMSLWGPRIVVGSPIALLGTPPASECPRVYEYLETATRWRLRAVIVEPKCGDSDGFGTSVSIWRTIALVGSPGENDSAGAFSYIRLP